MQTLCTTSCNKTICRLLKLWCTLPSQLNHQFCSCCERWELQHNLRQCFRTTSCGGATDNTHTVGVSVASAAVRETCSSICPSQWGSVGLSRLANQSLSPPVLLRSSRLHRAGCWAQSTMPTNAVSAEPLQKRKKEKKIHVQSLWTRERSNEFKTSRENTVLSFFELLLIFL